MLPVNKRFLQCPIYISIVLQSVLFREHPKFKSSPPSLDFLLQRTLIFPLTSLTRKITLYSSDKSQEESSSSFPFSLPITVSRKVNRSIGRDMMILRKKGDEVPTYKVEGPFRFVQP